jgi:hypothetical protein
MQEQEEVGRCVARETAGVKKPAAAVFLFLPTLNQAEEHAPLLLLSSP